MKKDKKQKGKNILTRFNDRVFWMNVLAMVIVLVIAFVAVNLWLSSYTHHGEKIVVPNVEKMSFTNARIVMESSGLNIVVSDTGYNRRLPADCILMQIPAADAEVKAGRTVYVTVNSASSPSLVIPDLINNCSLREAEARLTAIGFKLLEPKHVDGERDWVMGIDARGRMLQAGDRVSVEMPLRIHVGTGNAETEVREEASSDSIDAVSDEADAEEEVILIR